MTDPALSWASERWLMQALGELPPSKRPEALQQIWLAPPRRFLFFPIIGIVLLLFRLFVPR